MFDPKVAQHQVIAFAFVTGVAVGVVMTFAIWAVMVYAWSLT